MMEKTTFVYFSLWDEYFAIDVAKVVEVLQLPQVVKVPATPDFVLGVINFRGDIIPVIDLRKKFKLPQAQSPEQSRYAIVVRYSAERVEHKIALVVDRVMDVINVQKYDISNFPELGSRYNPEFIFGVLKYQDKFILVLDIDKILSAAEVEILRNLKYKQPDAGAEA